MAQAHSSQDSPLPGPLPAELPPTPGTWTTAQVAIWLKSVGFAQYVDNFVENEIEGSHLLELGKNDLKEDLEIARLGHRMSILKAIESLRDMC